MKVHDLAPPAGSRRGRRRVGRGIAGKGGKTAGRGTKGLKARGSVKPGFEGGQLPLAQRVPKLRGFNNPTRITYHVVNLDVLSSFTGDDAGPDTLAAAGLVRRGSLVKILGRGAIGRPMMVRAHAFSASARQAVEAAGGTCEVIALPYKSGRPPVTGSAHTNR